MAREPRLRRPGGITISALSHEQILRLSRHGRLSVLLAGVNAPGGEIVRGRFLYFTTDDLIPPALGGTIARLDLLTGKSTAWASGLTMPNGLAFLPDGDAVVSRDDETGPPPTDVTRLPAGNRRHPHFNWVRVPDANGLVVDPSGRWLYADRTFSPDGLVDRASIVHPRMVRVIGRLGPGVLPDDMTIASGGPVHRGLRERQALPAGPAHPRLMRDRQRPRQSDRGDLRWARLADLAPVRHGRARSLVRADAPVDAALAYPDSDLTPLPAAASNSPRPRARR
jgi:hypothetical protein